MWKAQKGTIDSDGFSVQLFHLSSGKYYWFDLWFDRYGDITGDWNQYIFYLTDEDDLKRKRVQENANNYMKALNASIDFLAKHHIIEQDQDGNWHQIKFADNGEEKIV